MKPTIDWRLLTRLSDWTQRRLNALLCRAFRKPVPARSVLERWEVDIDVSGRDSISEYLDHAIELALVAADRIPTGISRIIDAQITTISEAGVGLRRSLVIGLNFSRCSPEVQAAAEHLLEVIKRESDRV